MLGILDVVVDRGQVPVTLRDQGGRERSVVLAVPAGRQVELTEPGALMTGLGFSFWYPRLPVIVGQLVEGGSAAAAGLRPGDEIYAVDGEPVEDFSRFVELVRNRPGETLTFDLRRGGATLRLEVPVRTEVEDGRNIGRIGMSAGGSASFPESMRTEERYGPLAALRPAVAETWSKTVLTVKFLWRMVTGHVSTKNISGPINIAQYAGLSALGGMTYFLGFMALISISLGVLNLLPIPILDGGQVLYQVVEMVKGSPVSEDLQLAGQKVGIAFLVALMGFAFYNDIVRLIG
jgi:regulator of sigma E protease